MAGHSHAANIMYKKAAVDRKRAVLFSKVARLIIVAAKTGGGDPDGNIRLKFAVEKARAANMTNDAIKRAIQKGTGELGGQNYEDVTYEGYGPGGVALMATALTDNRARTAGEVKNILARLGGSIGTPGSVAWQFEKKAIIEGSPSGKSEDEILMAVMDAGAEDLEWTPEVFVVLGPPEALAALKAAVEGLGLPVSSAEIAWDAKNRVPVGDPEAARKVLALVDELEDHDDVQSVVHNADIPDEVMAKARSAG
ncbi:MAG: YebC/PmpR family DNA-binding transcriptional regulator [Planctomycetaceae bacterium]|nr:YebC/PmpR family DNA-binding transcriptional regulator [Planctomycetota bacterium]NUN52646.1 YebC/PmpR family DNA-binding transcriptional regulator [Planctomycetaceae bacterium]